MGKSLVALDTDHIKEYVFGTNKLKEIRGASSLLDYLNRIVMKKSVASEPLDEKYIIYTNGGSGLFLIDADKADDFGKRVQKAFRDETGGGASITYVVQELPKDAPEDMNKLLEYPLADTLAQMRYRLREAKGGWYETKNDEPEAQDAPPQIIALPSHPFMYLCDACGVEYANPEAKKKSGEVIHDPGEENELYCTSCQNKRIRDNHVKKDIRKIEEGQPTPDEYLWNHLITSLRAKDYYSFEKDHPDRPHDFNAFSNFKGAKDYLGLIYADANGMGKKIEACNTLAKLKTFATDVDEAIYDAVCVAITKHLKIQDHLKPRAELRDDLKDPIFPFDILLLGGDDVLMVTPASVALDVALTLAEKFHEGTSGEHTLSVGVVLAPIKYPFGLLQSLVSDTLKFAKKEGSKTQATSQSKYSDTRINFMTVTGSTSHDFKKVYASLHDKKVRVSDHKGDVAFYATLRPYEVERLDFLLEAIRKGHKQALGRTKLHQVRQAVLKKNLTTSVGEGLAVLRNWRERQRSFVMQHVFEFGERYQRQYSDPQNPGSMFPRVTFPWFADGADTYRTSLLDLVELYDFVAREEVDSDNEN